MRKTIILMALLTWAAVAAAKDAPTTKPSTQPARVDPAFVADFNEHLLNVPLDEVVAKLRAMGAVAKAMELKGTTGMRGYRLELGYSWEYASYLIGADAKGLVRKFEFSTMQWPTAPGADPTAPSEQNKLKPGNKWWLVKSRTFAQDPADPALAPHQRDGIVGLELTQARTADEAGKKLIADWAKSRKRTYASMKQEAPEWATKMVEVEVHEWFTPQLKARHAERVD